jgi:predicted  nucleic acid-binding Zn-ribbon protein
VREEAEIEIMEVNKRTVCVRNEVDGLLGKWKRMEEEWKRLEERNRENEGEKAEKIAKFDREEAQKHTNLRKEIAFYEDQISIISSRHEMLVAEVQKAQWRLGTLSTEEKQANEEEQNLRNQLQEAEKRAKLAINPGKLREIACGKCLERVEKGIREDEGIQVSLPIDEGNKKVKSDSKSICEVS